MAYEFYIQPHEYEIAAQNGISKGTLEQRIWKSAWSKDKAITKAPRESKSIKQWVEIAENNGIAYATLQAKNKPYGVESREGNN